MSLRNDWGLFSLILCVMNVSVVLYIQNYSHKCLFNDLQLMKIEAMKMSSLILPSLHNTNAFQSYTASLKEYDSEFSESRQEAVIMSVLMGGFSLSPLLLHCFMHCHGGWWCPLGQCKIQHHPTETVSLLFHWDRDKCWDHIEQEALGAII